MPHTCADAQGARCDRRGAADARQHVRADRRTEADLPDQHPVLMRCFDPRVLPELVHQLKASQNETFLALGHEWLYLDRSLRLQALPLHAAPGVDMFEAPLQLDEAQFTALLDASELDQVMPELAREAPLEFLALRADQRASCLDLAGTWHLERLADKVMVAVALVLVATDSVSLWVTIPAIIMISREIVISALREWMAQLGKRANVAVSNLGKYKTIAQMLALIGLIWRPEHWLVSWFTPAGMLLLYLATLLTLWSMYVYLKAAWHDLLH